MARIYGKVVIVVKKLKSPLGRDMGQRTYVLAHPPVMSKAFGELVINAERSDILQWAAGDCAERLAVEFAKDGYEPYFG